MVLRKFRNPYIPLTFFKIMESSTIKLPKQVMDSIKEIVKKTNLYVDEADFVQQAIMKQITKFKNL